MDSKPSGRAREVICEPTNAPLFTWRRLDGKAREVICAEEKAPSSMVVVPSETV
jgi:hypothetical protein